jgi:hypothetical protein
VRSGTLDPDDEPARPTEVSMPAMPDWMWKVLPVALVVGLAMAAAGWLGPLSTLVPVLLVLLLLRRLPRGTRYSPYVPKDADPRPGEVARDVAFPGWQLPPEPRFDLVREPQPQPQPQPQQHVRPDARHGVTAPDMLTGDGGTDGAVPEGWYPTADGSRERWHNGAGWTAHERMPGSG